MSTSATTAGAPTSKYSCFTLALTTSSSSPRCTTSPPAISCRTTIRCRSSDLADQLPTASSPFERFACAPDASQETATFYPARSRPHQASQARAYYAPLHHQIQSYDQPSTL